MIYNKIKIIAFVIIIVLLLPFLGYADVIITKDDMVLNGKVLEQSNESVVFANYYGVFKIKRKMIKSLFITGSIEGDIAVFKRLRKRVNVKEIKRNYEKGIQKRYLAGKNVLKKLKMHITPCYYNNVLDFQNFISHDIGGAITIDFLNKFSSLPDFRVEIDYRYLPGGKDYLHGSALTFGPLWSTENPRFNINVAALFGAGYYYLQSYNEVNEKFSAYKLGMQFKLIIGFDIAIGDFHIVPQLRANYIHDSISPLLGFGGGLAFGYAFF